MAVAAVHGQTIEPYAGATGAIAEQIAPDGSVRVVLLGTARGNARAILGDFADAEGRALEVVFAAPGAPRERNVTLDGPRVVLELTAANARPGVAYSGELWVALDDRREARTLTLTRAALRHYQTPSSPLVVVAAGVDGRADFSFDATQLWPGATEATASIGTFASATGRVATVRLAQTQLALTGEFVRIELDGAELMTGVAYTGVVTLRAGAVDSVANVQLTRYGAAGPADPVASPTVVPLKVICWRRCEPPAEDVLLSEAGMDDALAGVFVTVGSPPAEPAAAELLLPGDFVVTLAGGTESLLTVAAEAGDVAERTVEPRGQTKIRIGLAAVPEPGLYKATLKVGAVNADTARFDDVTVTLQVERPLWIAALVLTIGVLASWLATKGVATLRRRAELAKRIDDIGRNYWLRLDRAGTEPIVRALASASKMRAALAREHWLRRFSVPTVVSKEIEQLEKHVPYLERLAACLAYWDGRNGFVARRARKALRELVMKMQSVALTADPQPLVDGAMKGMEQWQDEALLDQCYVAHVKIDTTDLLAKVAAAVLDPNSPVDAAIQQLVPVVRNGAATATTRAAGETLDGDYSMLKLLWDYREHKDLGPKLARAHTTTANPDALFKIVDSAAWAQLRRGNSVTIDDGRQLGLRDTEIAEPAAVGWRRGTWKARFAAAKTKRLAARDGAEVYQLITLAVKPGDKNDGGNFLFKHGLQYEWEISFPGRRPLTPVTREPRVTQFIPVVATNVKVSVIVRNERAAKPIDNVTPRYFSTRVSTEFRASRAFATAEMLALGLAVVFAVATGLSSEYLEANLLGSFGDYLSLFVWGVAMDQAKNFFQGLSPQT